MTDEEQLSPTTNDNIDNIKSSSKENENDEDEYDNDNDTHSDNVDDEDEDEFRSHSFRERRLTYSRHHVLSDTAAAAVAKLLAEGDDDFSEEDERRETKEEGGDETAATTTTTTEDGTTKKDGLTAEENSSQQQQLSNHKRRRGSTSSANSDASNKPPPPAATAAVYLPSRILHAGEIVRRYSMDQQLQQQKQLQGDGGGESTNYSAMAHHQHQPPPTHDVRTGAYSHPTHHATSKKYIPNHHHNHHHHYPHKNKWRQRFSFCSTTPDYILPFPRHVVGTFSCHGMEPVYDSDYDNSDNDDNNESDENENNNNNYKANNTSIAKINQDRGGIIYPYANSHNMALFAVYDGHGEGGELVSQFALGEVSRILSKRLVEYELKKKKKKKGEDLHKKTRKKRRRRRGMMMESVQEGEEEEDDDEENTAEDDEEKSTTKDGHDFDDEKEEEEEEKFIEQCLKETFIKVDRGLLDEEEIEPMYSGTTACVVLKRYQKLYIANCGDSRAILARRGSASQRKDDGEQSSFITIPLSIDQNPDSPGEEERILNSGGYVSPPPEPGLSARVWLDSNMTQIGLAMARSIGDHAVKGVGVIAEPVVSVHNVDEELDEFVIIASDGVWEFISSEDAVDIVWRHLYDTNSEKEDVGSGCGATEACEALIKAATAKWHDYEGDYRDDITAMVIRLKDLW
jgi:serine/threonine protein phosphatase PrpC